MKINDYVRTPRFLTVRINAVFDSIEEAAKEVGIRAETCQLSHETPEEMLLAKISELNHRHDIDAILVQLPLPAHISPSKCLLAIEQRFTI